MQNATIHNPKDNSLEMRVQALKETRQAVHNVEASLGYTKLNGFNSALGTEKELKSAQAISKNSYKDAVKSLSRSDLSKAKDQKLLSPNEYAKLSIAKDKAQIQKVRANNTSNNKSHGKDNTFQK